MRQKLGTRKSHGEKVVKDNPLIDAQVESRDARLAPALGGRTSAVWLPWGRISSWKDIRLSGGDGMLSTAPCSALLRSPPVSAC